MTLGELWKKLDSDKLSKPVVGTVHIQKKSKHPIQKLKNLYLATMAFIVVFLVCFFILFFTFNELIIKSGLVLIIITYVLGFITNYSMYKKIKVELPVDQSLKDVLQNTYKSINTNIRFQERTALFFAPIALATGFLGGGSVGSGGNLEAMMQEKIVAIALIVTLIVFTPASYFLTKWLNKISYGKCLTELKSRIDELERPD
jgi:hypothetical protein